MLCSHIVQNMISAGTPVRRTANREPRTANLWLIVAEANAGHRCCDIVDRGPQKRLNYNDKGLKLRDGRLTKQYLLLFVLHCHSDMRAQQVQHPHSLYMRWKGQVKTGQVEQLDLLCYVPEALRGCNSLK